MEMTVTDGNDATEASPAQAHVVVCVEEPSPPLYILRSPTEQGSLGLAESIVDYHASPAANAAAEQVRKVSGSFHSGMHRSLATFRPQRSRGSSQQSTIAEKPGPAPRSGWWTGKRKALLMAVRKDRKVVLVPLAVLVVCMGLALWGVVAAGHQEAEARRASAANRARDKAQTITSELRATYLPVKVLSAFIRRSLNFPQFVPSFPALASELIELTAANAIANLQLAPLGEVMEIVPIKGNEAALGHNLLNDTNNRDFALKTIAEKELSLAGPYMLRQGFMGAPARFPIFVSGVDENETFGLDYDVYDCPICYDPVTRTKFWGFATVLIDWDVFINQVVGIRELLDQGLDYRLTRQDDHTASQSVWLAGNRKAMPGQLEVHIPVPNNVWCLAVVDTRGWTPSWVYPLVAMVVVMSFILAALVAAAMLARAQQRLLLSEVLSANEQLEEAASVLIKEKDRMEALLRRQYDLIACLGGNADGSQSQPPASGRGSKAGRGAAGGLAAAGAGATGAYPGTGECPGDSSTADKIEHMRQQLMGQARISKTAAGGGGEPGGQGGQGTAPGTDVQLLEMIGEGTFGKVYRGLWRGTEVAVKTMVLPANMSGKEKREKMAVMEAAISSSLAHPNVVATYTYHIKAIKDSSSAPDHRPSIDVAPAGLLEDSPGPEHPPGKHGRDGNRGVHSYEVQLVLEYCDKGCLRDALDDGVFFGPTGLNYAAILETAADVAKALLHLHLNDVLHGDLKADNIMLKSSGGSGRGLAAKVADFGLAIKMDHCSTHVSSTVQGTLTHMSPEVLLHGQVSKAADVYAFGVTLWEMFTSGHPYQGVPGALLGHLTTKEGKRPVFPLAAPAAYRELAGRCWAADAADRPTFSAILEALTAMRAELPDPTPTITYTPAPRKPAASAAGPRRPGTSALGVVGPGKNPSTAAAPLPRPLPAIPRRRSQSNSLLIAAVHAAANRSRTALSCEALPGSAAAAGPSCADLDGAARAGLLTIGTPEPLSQRVSEDLGQGQATVEAAEAGTGVVVVPLGVAIGCSSDRSAVSAPLPAAAHHAALRSSAICGGHSSGSDLHITSGPSSLGMGSSEHLPAGAGGSGAPSTSSLCHHHHHSGSGVPVGRAGSGSGTGLLLPPPPHQQQQHRRRTSKSRSRGDDLIIQVGGRNVSLSAAITSKSVVLEPICETRYEGDLEAAGAYLEPTTP